jgi:hypothetical protein
MLWIIVIAALIALLTLWLAGQRSPEPMPARAAEQRRRQQR